MIAIRPAAPTDAASIALAHVASWRRAYAGILPRAMLDQATAERFEAMWQALLTRHAGSHPSLVAVAETGTIVGVATGSPAASAVPGIGGEIHMIFVAPDYQRRDLGRRLFVGLIALMTASGCDSLMASVLETPQAMGFFAAMGGVSLASTPIDLPDSHPKQHIFVWRDLARLFAAIEK